MKINPDKEYDFVIVGSGFGGMCCAYILANEGYSVGVVEKNIQLGGNLQIFSRDKVILDTGVHYIGGLDKGENLYRFFQYFGLTDTLKMQRLDDECFDLIQFSDGKSYKYGQGYPNFIKNLVADFPEEENAIRVFCDKIKEICKLFPLYNLEDENPNTYFDIDFRSINAQAYIASVTNNVRLQNVLAGSNILYAGVKDKTPLYVHALILNSYICGSYRLTDGGAQLIKQFSKRIKARGGEFFIHKEIIGADYAEDGSVIRTEQFKMINPDQTEVISTEKAPLVVNPINTQGKKWNPDGYNKVYNEDDEIWQDGIFKEGMLWEGKVYVYDRDGILLRVKIFKNGVYHSDGQL